MNWTDQLVRACILIINFEDDSSSYQRNLTWHQELLIPIAFSALFNQERLGLEPRRLIVQPYVTVRWILAANICVARHDPLASEETKAQLVILGLDLRGLDDVLNLGVGIILNTGLFIVLTGDDDADFELGGDLAKILWFRVAQNDPFVEQSVLRLLINVADIKLVKANQRILNKALV